ncbi:MAG: glycosyltransferase [Candidatus Kapabacteria bacterium]|nr:glycosyltransferase [Candidatus Kapabacteria bacterium]
MKISIGVCAKNEQCMIAANLDSILISASFLPSDIEWKLYLCLNGCTDKTEVIVRQWLIKHSTVTTELIILPIANLIESQREIVRRSRMDGASYNVFFDADILVNCKCLSELVAAINSPEVQVAYAVSRPMNSEKTNYIEKVLNLYDSDATIFTSRKHLHGRAFIIKDWNVPITSPLLLVDDIYLSFQLLSAGGVKSIRRVEGAVVKFRQIHSFKDYYRVNRRRTLELKKCFVLFPEFKKLPPDQFNRLFLWDKFYAESFSRKLSWLYLLAIKHFALYVYNLEKFFYPAMYEQWQPAVTSKRKRVAPLLVLVEGLDCSGKKTTVRNLRDKLTANGVSVDINFGPLGPKFYNLLVRFVSLHPMPNIIRSAVYTLEGLCERRMLKRMSHDVILQVSSPMRNWAYACQKKKFFRALISKMIKNTIADYDQIWFLTAAYNDRLRRHYNQVAAGENSDDINKRFMKKEQFEAMENKLEKLLSKKGINGKFNTSVSSQEFITSKIFERILINLNR